MASRRCEEVDVLRGAALLGICVVNIPVMAGIDPVTPPGAGMDRWVAALVALLFQGKFFVLFSFLFGWGFGVQRDSARRSGRRFGAAYARRLSCLLVFGAAHALLVFTGDILVLYAVLGLPLWWLRDVGPRRLTGIALALAAHRGRFFSAGAAAYDSLKKRWAWLLAAGVSLNGLYTVGMLGSLGDGAFALMAFSGLALGGPCLAGVYLIAIVELTRRRPAPRWLAVIGRMSLSAYVAEGVLAGWVFNGYGLGLYGSVGDTACLFIALTLFAIVSVACRAWSQVSTTGPLEWPLRAATRGRLT